MLHSLSICQVSLIKQFLKTMYENDNYYRFLCTHTRVGTRVSSARRQNLLMAPPQLHENPQVKKVSYVSAYGLCDHIDASFCNLKPDFGTTPPRHLGTYVPPTPSYASDTHRKCNFCIILNSL